MATRSRIGLRLADDSILSVYHHYDGYPQWLGVTLNKKFNTFDKVAELLDGGDISAVIVIATGITIRLKIMYYTIMLEEKRPSLD